MKEKLKKVTLSLLVICLLLVGCGNKNETGNNTLNFKDNKIMVNICGV